uniref:PPM-type phosphatase domain-containing protein n=2 Tax=Leptocylindrus danicus TaxID=163516 RepID=A0A7S2KG14_9STRA|mmetsp:Transcript_22478/g.33702  ORF Transcript_22478/g.33702 Transcript_22478/m.33702 type:complete len:116 (+) Transcript_22478:148-495(+)
MSRAFGDFDYKTNKELPHESQAVIAVPEVKILERSSKDEFIVLACDGVWDVMTNEECAAFVSKECNRDSEPEDLAKMCDDLLRDCFDRGSTDNMSVLVVSLLAPLGTGQTLDFGE